MRASAKPKAAPKWQPASAQMVRIFEIAMQAVPGAHDDVQVRPMFGCPSAFIHGHMFAGVFQDTIFLRLSAADRADFLLLQDAAPFEPIAGRPMREYVVAPPSLLKSHARLVKWLGRSLAYANSLPAKPAAPPNAAA